MLIETAVQSVAAGPAAYHGPTVQWLSDIIADILSQPLGIVEAARNMLATSCSLDPSIIDDLVENGSLERLLQQLAGATAKLRSCNCTPASVSGNQAPDCAEWRSCAKSEYHLFYEVLVTLCTSSSLASLKKRRPASSNLQAWSISSNAMTVLSQQEQLQQLFVLFRLSSELVGPLVRSIAQTEAGCQAMINGGQLATLMDTLAATAADTADKLLGDCSAGRVFGTLRCLAKTPRGVAALLQQNLLQQLCKASLVYVGPSRVTSHQEAKDLLASLLAHEAVVQQFVQLQGPEYEISLKQLIEALAVKPRRPSGRDGRIRDRIERWYEKGRQTADTLVKLVVKHEAGRLAMCSDENLQLLLKAMLSSRSGARYAMMLLGDLTKHEQSRQAMQQHIRGRLAAEVSRLRGCSSDCAAQWVDKCEQLLNAIDGACGEQQPQPPLVAAEPASAAARSLLPQQHREQQQPQEQQQQQEQQQRMATAAVVQRTGAVVPPKQQQQQQQRRAALDVGTSAAAAAGLGPVAFAEVKRELGAIPNQQQQPYWAQADKPYNHEELQQLVQHYLLPRPGLKEKELRAGRTRRVPVQAHNSLVQQHYGALEPRLTGLYREVVAGHGESSAAAAVALNMKQAAAATPKRKAAAAGSEAPELTAAQTLLWALRCLRLWETHQATQPEMPQVLQQLFSERSGSAAASAVAAAEVQVVINVAGAADGDGDQTASGASQQQQPDCMVVRIVKGALDGKSAKRVKTEPSLDTE